MKTKTIQACTLMAALLLMTGCKSSNKLATAAESPFLSSDVQLTLPMRGGDMSVNGTMKMVSGEGVQLSFAMPLFGSEVARLEMTPDTLLVVDRMNRRYVQAPVSAVNAMITRKVSFAQVEKLIRDAAKPDGKRTLTGKELGLPGLDKAQIGLSNFSNKTFTWNRTQPSARYERVDWELLLKALLNP
jgi:hypothetical protein